MDIGETIRTLGSLVAVVGFLILVGGWLVRRYERMGEASRYRTVKTLNELAPGVSAGGLRKLFGDPVAEMTDGTGSIDAIYATPHALIGMPSAATSASRLYITITDANLVFDTGTLTPGVDGIRLGRDYFSALPDEGERWGSVGNRVWVYYETFRGGGTNDFHDFVFSHSMVGVPDISGPEPDEWAPDETARYREGTRINTLAVFDPEDDAVLWPYHEPKHRGLWKLQGDPGREVDLESRRDRWLTAAGRFLSQRFRA